VNQEEDAAAELCCIVHTQGVVAHFTVVCRQATRYEEEDLAAKIRDSLSTLPVRWGELLEHVHADAGGQAAEEQQAGVLEEGGGAWCSTVTVRNASKLSSGSFNMPHNVRRSSGVCIAAG
jgi:hypothetical protein